MRSNLLASHKNEIALLRASQPHKPLLAMTQRDFGKALGCQFGKSVCITFAKKTLSVISGIHHEIYYGYGRTVGVGGRNVGVAEAGTNVGVAETGASVGDSVKV